MRTPDAATSDASATSAGRSPGSWRPAQATEELGVTVFDVARDLRRDVADVRLPLAIDGATEADASRRRLLTQLDEHLLPRLRELSSPAIVVIAGSTGAGKSTLYNSCSARRCRRQACCGPRRASRCSRSTRSTRTSSSKAR
nr:hypothetical protein [Cellulosimicrobium sp. MM]